LFQSGLSVWFAVTGGVIAAERVAALSVPSAVVPRASLTAGVLVCGINGSLVLCVFMAVGFAVWFIVGGLRFGFMKYVVPMLVVFVCFCGIVCFLGLTKHRVCAR